MKRSLILLTILLPLLGLLALMHVARLQASQPTVGSGVTFVVNSTLDATDANPGDGVCETMAGNGICTLRAAVQETNALTGVDQIDLPTGNYLLSIAGEFEDEAMTGDLDITDDLIISGEDKETTIIDGNLLDRVFHNVGVIVSISNVKITNGQTSGSYGGGGIYNGHLTGHPGTLTLDNVIIIDNHAIGVDINSRGGGVYSSGPLSITNSLIVNNSALSSSGGGIDNNNYPTVMRQTTVLSNVAKFSGGGVNAWEITLIDSIIEENKLLGGVGSIRGGGVFVGGDSIIENSLILNNTIFEGLGGGVFVQGNASITVTSSSIISNSTFTDEGNTGTRGAGIYIESNQNVWIEDTIIHGNNSGSSGGGIYYDPSFNSGEMQLNRVTVSQNVAPSRGAGIYNNGGTMSLINVTISGNQAVGPLDMEGGGIYQYEGAFLLVNSTIAQNEAYDGGGIYNLYGDIFLENTILANNIASGDPNTHNCFGTITSNGYNLEDGAFCNLSMLGDLTNIDPLLMPLSMNGGETAVHPLAVGSPAIDAGNNLSCPLTDQRGGIRPVDGDGDNDPICDIGAYEYGALQLTAVDDVVSTQINMPILIDVLLNDMPGENGLPMLDSVGEPLSGTTVISGSAILYIPISDFTGIDNFTYIITDGVVMDTAVVTVTILPLIAPTAVSDVITTTQNVSILIDVLANDMPGNGGNLILDDLGNPLSGTATISGTFVLYAPNLDMIGTDAFTYTISDGVLTDTTVVTVTVLPMDNQGFVYLPMVLKPEE